MSNSAVVSPIIQETTAAIGAAIAETVRAVASAFAYTDAEREVAARYREGAQHNRVSLAHVGATVLAHDQLLSAAQSAGFQLAHGGDMRALHAGRPVALVGPGASSVVLRKVKNRVALMSADGPAPINAIMRTNTLLTAQRHLSALAGGKVEVRQLADGEVELRAKEATSDNQPGAEIKMKIRATGESAIDVACVKGGRCETIVRDVAAATGGEVRSMKLKDEYYDAGASPGEPTRVKSGS